MDFEINFEFDISSPTENLFKMVIFTVFLDDIKIKNNADSSFQQVEGYSLHISYIGKLM